MNVQRGDVLKARFPHATGERGKKRPVVVVQANAYNHRLRHAVVVEITGNLAEADDPACLFMDSSTPGARAAGLSRAGGKGCYRFLTTAWWRRFLNRRRSGWSPGPRGESAAARPGGSKGARSGRRGAGQPLPSIPPTRRESPPNRTVVRV